MPFKKNKFTPFPCEIKRALNDNSFSLLRQEVDLDKETNEEQLPTVKSSHKWEEIPFVATVSMNLLLQYINDSKVKASIIPLRNGDIKIFADSAKDYKLMKEWLKTYQIPFHTYAPDQDYKKYIITGLPIDYPPHEEVMRAFLSVEGVVSVFRMNKRTANGSIKPLSPFIVLTSLNVTKEALLHLVHIGHVRFNVELPKKNKIENFIECRRCQRLGHLSISCFRPPVCAICSGNHLSSQCPTPNELRCAYCSGDHPATFHSCHLKKKIAMRMQLLKNKNVRQIGSSNDLMLNFAEESTKGPGCCSLHNDLIKYLIENDMQTQQYLQEILQKQQQIIYLLTRK